MIIWICIDGSPEIALNIEWLKIEPIRAFQCLQLKPLDGHVDQ